MNPDRPYTIYRPESSLHSTTANRAAKVAEARIKMYLDSVGAPEGVAITVAPLGGGRTVGVYGSRNNLPLPPQFMEPLRQIANEAYTEEEARWGERALGAVAPAMGLLGRATGIDAIEGAVDVTRRGYGLLQQASQDMADTARYGYGLLGNWVQDQIMSGGGGSKRSPRAQAAERFAGR